MSQPASQTLERRDLDELFAALSRRGYTILGPTVHAQAIVYGELTSSADLPQGWTDEQEAGHYRLRRRDDDALFGYNVGPHSWKRHQLPAERRLFRARRDENGGLTDIEQPAPDERRYAFLGVRSCELHAMGILDRVLLGGAHTDPRGAPAREGVFIVAVQCTQAGSTCFCSSMGTGPQASSGYDIALTEVIEDERHYFVLDVGSESGAELLAELAHAPAGPSEEAAAQAGRAHGGPARWAASST